MAAFNKQLIEDIREEISTAEDEEEIDLDFKIGNDWKLSKGPKRSNSALDKQVEVNCPLKWF